MQNFISDIPDSSLYAQHLNISEKELKSFLSNYGCLTSKFQNEEYGEIRIFRLGWDEASGDPNQVNSINCMDGSE
jgi:hypothetical protein